jgi:hypothetical protein
MNEWMNVDFPMVFCVSELWQEVIPLFSAAYKYITRRSQCSRRLKRRSVDARLLECGLESCLGHKYLSFVSVMCCQVAVSASDWSLVQRSPTDCGVLGCDCENLIMGLSEVEQIVTLYYGVKINWFVDEIIVKLQCGFRRNRSTTDHKFSIR